ncbi:hypothetical protein [Candidatus Nitrosocosmicus sp. T]
MKFFSPNKIVGLILVAFFILSRFYDLPTYVSSILSLCWFLYVPYALGFLILEISRRYLKRLNSSIESIDIVIHILNWFVGIVAVSAIVYSLFTADVPIIGIIGPLLLFISIAAIFVFESSKSLQSFKKYHLRIVLILIIGITFALYIRSFSPYPLSPGIDVFNHMYVIQNILDNSDEVLLVYPPTFDITIALGSSTFDADLNSVFWMGSILIGMLFSLSCYVMLCYFLKNNTQAIFGTVIALPLTETAFASNLQFFYPSSFVMSIFPLMIFSIDYLWKKLVDTNRMVALVFTVTIFAIFILIHSYIGFIVVVALSVYIFCFYYLSKKDRSFFIFRLLTVAFSLILLAYCLGFVTFQFKLDFIEHKTFLTYDMFETPTKVRHLEQWYTEQILLASAIGFFLLSFYKDKKIVILNFIGVVMLLIYFQQISDIQRIMPLERAFLALGAVTTFTLPIIILTQKFKTSHMFYNNMKKIKLRPTNASQTDIENKNSKKIIEKLRSIQLTNSLGIFQTHHKDSKILSIYVIIVFAFIYPVLLVPFDAYTDPLTSLGYPLTTYTFEELDASKWIKENIPENYKIYSDPSTVIEMRGLSNRPNIEGIGWNLTVASEVRSVLLSENATYAYESILTNHGKNTAIVITPRTSEWLRGDTFFTQLPIKEFKYFEGVEKFFDENYFRLEYRNDNILIFVLR